MSKESRRRQRAASQTTATAGTGPATGQPSQHPSTSPSGASRAGRRERSRYAQEKSFAERYRGLLVGLAVILVVGLAGIGIVVASTETAYACTTEWMPDPTPSPPAGATAQPGYVQPDMGQGHVTTGVKLTYTYCPPASGKHYNTTGSGPITPRVYGPDDAVIPEGWIHNLEHGALIVLYRGDSWGATPEGQAAMKAFFETYPNSPVCNFKAGTSIGPVFARFDQMKTPFTAMVWGRVLPLETFDTTAILQLDQAYGERTNPEKYCETPSASPSTEPSGSPTSEPSASPG